MLCPKCKTAWYNIESTSWHLGMCYACALKQANRLHDVKEAKEREFDLACKAGISGPYIGAARRNRQKAQDRYSAWVHTIARARGEE